jgi:hypothetical protein
MFLERSEKNRLSVGKQLRRLKGLRKKDESAQQLAAPPALEEYKAELEARGMQVGALALGLFQTRNGLKYPGFIATEDIGANSILLRVPVGCLLTTRDAYLSEIRRYSSVDSASSSRTRASSRRRFRRTGRTAFC